MSTETTPLSSTPRTTLRRHRERGQADRAALYEVLDAGLICHLGVVAAGEPVVLPTAYGRDGDTLYLHGSSANGAFRAANGRRVCVTVTHLDGLVAARSVFSHSMNYRSAVVLGTATVVTDPDERWQALRLITDHLIPGRWAAARQPTAKELAATAVLSLPLAEASVKVRTGMPADEPGDLELDVWAGVLPVAVTFGAPVPDPVLGDRIPLPAHIRDAVSPGRGRARLVPPRRGPRPAAARGPAAERPRAVALVYQGDAGRSRGGGRGPTARRSACTRARCRGARLGRSRSPGRWP